AGDRASDVDGYGDGGGGTRSGSGKRARAAGGAVCDPFTGRRNGKNHCTRKAKAGVKKGGTGGGDRPAEVSEGGHGTRGISPAVDGFAARTGANAGRDRQMKPVLLSMIYAASLAAADPAVDKCRALQHHGQQAQARVCFSALATNPDPFLSAEGYFGLGEFDAANQG